uniref:Uncharacterized protein n=1 Tax=Anguilla anguilla TaxID=7936 RepID=A0A0E9U4T8_ANGAN
MFYLLYILDLISFHIKTPLGHLDIFSENSSWTG